jgi:EAL domain-containing protein (putative c-di-GMP-specific phosphodiesterase class I)
MISLAHNLGMDVVAEGIETEEQAREVRLLGLNMPRDFSSPNP